MISNSITTIMTKDVVCVTPEQQILDVKHIYEKKNFHHHIPVTKNGKLVGMISLIDFMYHIEGAGIKDDNTIYRDLKVKDIMSEHPFFLSQKATIKEVAEVLAEGNYHAIPITDNGEILGIVSTTDIIKYFIKN